ncbi:MAG: WGR domain-containing protein [Deltaproteobacteria bacterium]|nr:WGR domain-containing protein [Deltaproteobacteria bacterium]
MPRYEFVEGSSSKFWDIKLAGSSFTTTFGKIGSTGQTQIKKFASDAVAQKEHDKLVAEKVKKGYHLVDLAPPPKKAAGAPKAVAKAKPAAPAAGLDARNPGLEAAIVADPTDRAAWAIYGDWLQEQGDPRGQLVALQLGNKEKQAKALLDEHAAYFLGPLAEHRTVYDEGYNNSRSHLRTTEQEKHWQKVHKEAFLWRNGFIHRVRLSHDHYSCESFKGECSDILSQVLSHPSGRFVVELAFMSNGDPNEDDLQSLIDVLAKKAPPTVRRLTFGDNVDQISWHRTGKLGKLWKAVPNLRLFEIETGHFDVGKDMNAPALEKAVFITGGLSKACGKNIAAAAMPSIEHLEIYYGSEDYGGSCTVKEVEPLLARTDLRRLRYLGLKNSMFANDIARALYGAKVLSTVKTLDLSLGTMTDEGAEALVAAKDSLKHLDCLDLTRNYLTKKGIALVKNLCKKVIVAGQEQADDDGEDTYYYVSIAE